MKTNACNKLRLMLGSVVGLVLAGLCGSLPAGAQEFKVQYFNTAVTENYVKLWNPSVQSVSNRQLVCEMIYVFDAHEELQECCGCPVTNNGLRNILVTRDLTANPLGGGRPVNGVIKIVTTNINSSTTFAPCNPALLNSQSPFLEPTPGWISHVEKIALPTGSAARETEHDFEEAPLGVAELNALAGNCSMIHTNGTGRGICGCGVGDNVAPVAGAGGR